MRGIRRKLLLLRHVASVSDPVTAGIVLGVSALAGIGLGAWGGSVKQSEDERKAEYNANDAQAQLNIFDAQKTEATNSAIKQATMKADEAAGGFASGVGSLAAQNETGNKDVAKAMADADRDAGTRAAAVGRSGVKNSGSTSIVQSQIKTENADTIKSAVSSMNKSVALNVMNMGFQRDLAFQSSRDVMASYAEGGDQFKVFQEQRERIRLGKAYADTELANVKDSALLTILGGGFNGLGTGLNIGKSLLSFGAM